MSENFGSLRYNTIQAANNKDTDKTVDSQADLQFSCLHRLKHGFLLMKVMYRKTPKFLDARKLCCNLPKIQEKRPNLRASRHKDANGIANSEDPDQTAPLGAV